VHGRAELLLLLRWEVRQQLAALAVAALVDLAASAVVKALTVAPERQKWVWVPSQHGPRHSIDHAMRLCCGPRGLSLDCLDGCVEAFLIDDDGWQTEWECVCKPVWVGGLHHALLQDG